jgi:hypothetical protein
MQLIDGHDRVASIDRSARQSRKVGQPKHCFFGAEMAGIRMGAPFLISTRAPAVRMRFFRHDFAAPTSDAVSAPLDDFERSMEWAIDLAQPGV